MFLYLLLSTVAAGLIATFVMLFFLYLPLLWQGAYYDVLGALGSAVTRQVDARSRLIGGVLYVAGGLFFAFFYGWIALALLQTTAPMPTWTIFPNWPVEINLFFPALGLVIGLGHGIVIALLTTIVVIEHHPMEEFRTRYTLILANLIGHIVFGATVMFFHSQFLQLLLGLNGQT